MIKISYKIPKDYSIHIYVTVNYGRVQGKISITDTPYYRSLYSFPRPRDDCDSILRYSESIPVRFTTYVCTVAQADRTLIF